MAADTVTRAQLSEAVYQEVGLSRNESAQLVESVLNEMADALARGDTFSAVSSFGDAIALKPDSMLGYLKRGDAHRLRGDLETAAGDLETARRLDMDAATPCLSMTRRTWSDEHLISYARLIHPGDRYKLRSSLRRRGEHA